MRSIPALRVNETGPIQPTWSISLQDIDGNSFEARLFGDDSPECGNVPAEDVSLWVAARPVAGSDESGIGAFVRDVVADTIFNGRGVLVQQILVHHGGLIVVDCLRCHPRSNLMRHFWVVKR